MKYIKSGALFKKYREEKLKLTQADLAASLNCNPVQISQWERGIARVPARCLKTMEKAHAEFPVKKYYDCYLKETIGIYKHSIQKQMD